MTSFINNEQPKESLHMIIMLIIFFKFQQNSVKALARIIRFCNSMCPHDSLMRIEYELTNSHQRKRIPEVNWIIRIIRFEFDAH